MPPAAQKPIPYLFSSLISNTHRILYITTSFPQPYNGFVRIQSSRTKTCQFRASRVCQTTLQAIQESLQPGQEWLFPGRSSGHLCTKTVLRIVDRLAEEAGIQEISRRQKLSRKKVTPHILRHSHVVNVLMAGAPVPMIQKQVRHKRLSTTEI